MWLNRNARTSGVRAGRKLVGLAVAVTMVGALGACGSDDGDGDAAGGGGGGDQAKSIKFRITDANLKPAMEELAATFEQENGVKVTVEASPWVDYWTKLTTEMTSGNAPDVIEMYASRYPSFRDQLTDISDTEVNLDDYNAADALVGEDDEVYGLPYSHNTNALLYNKTLLAEAGIPEEQLTWDPETGGTLLEAAKKLTKGDVYGFPVFNNDQDLYLNMIAGNGGWVMDDKAEKFQYDAPENVEVLEFITSLQNEHKVSPPGAEIAGSSAKVVDLFKAGRLGLFPSNSGRLNDIAKGAAGIEWGIMPYPQGPDGDVTIVGNVYAAVYKKSKAQDAARQWVEFIAGPEGQEVLARDRLVRPALKSAEEAWAKSWEAEGVDVSAYTNPDFRQQPLPITKGYVAAKQKIDAGFLEIYLGNLDPAEGAKKITEEAQELRDSAR
jgi:multiple sugar transport system substrate-binding protein